MVLLILLRLELTGLLLIVIRLEETYPSGPYLNPAIHVGLSTPLRSILLLDVLQALEGHQARPD
jgi:hypothetical protein